MSANNKLRKNVILLSCCMVAVLIVFVCISVSLSNKKKKKTDAAETVTIASLGDERIPENLFKFFARIILNQEEDTVRMLYTSSNLSDKDEIKKYTSNFAKEYLIRKTEAKAAGIALTEEENAQLEQRFAEDYEKAKSVDGKTLGREEFYRYYYGISEAEYQEFWKNWYMIDKYTTLCEQRADVGEEAQKKAFEEYYDYLYCYRTTVIPLFIDTANPKEAQTEKANSILTALNEGADMTELLRQNTSDETLLQNNGVMNFYPANKYEYSEVYDWLRSSETGSRGVVQTNTVIYVIRLDGITDFEQLKNTETMLQWTRTFAVNQELNELLNSEKYRYEINQRVYDACDLSGILQEAYDYWKTIWENEAK